MGLTIQGFISCDFHGCARSGAVEVKPQALGPMRIPDAWSHDGASKWFCPEHSEIPPKVGTMGVSRDLVELRHSRYLESEVERLGKLCTALWDWRYENRARAASASLSLKTLLDAFDEEPVNPDQGGPKR